MHGVERTDSEQHASEAPFHFCSNTARTNGHAVLVQFSDQRGPWVDLREAHKHTMPLACEFISHTARNIVRGIPRDTVPNMAGRPALHATSHQPPHMPHTAPYPTPHGIASEGIANVQHIGAHRGELVRRGGKARQQITAEQRPRFVLYKTEADVSDRRSGFQRRNQAADDAGQPCSSMATAGRTA